MNCASCDEPVDADGWKNVIGEQPFHGECFFRMVMGCVAHIEKRCSCFVPGSHEHDPEGMTLREGARAAVKAWELLQRQDLKRHDDAKQDDGNP